MLMNPPTLPEGYVPGVPTEDLVRALELIQHATAPSHKDGAYHEAAHDIASEVLKRLETRRQWEMENAAKQKAYRPRTTPIGAGAVPPQEGDGTKCSPSLPAARSRPSG